tara:strand:+ start:60421 stop:61221 length:801 start_codon:yes stop_codon:yes gene_type:complete
MECKNCELPLRTDYSHCPACGAKIIRNRLTIKNLWFDFTERFFNIDNTFFLTFKHLFIKPEVVIVGYIKGVRKRYMNPISYFTIAVFLGGIFFFLNKKFFPDAMNYQFTQIAYSGSDEAQKFSLGLMKNFQDILQEYQNLFYIGMLPFLVIISKLVFFNKKQFNLSEHFVINIYAYSQMSILINILYILSIWNSKLIYWEATINSLFLLIYFSYVYKRTFKLNWGQILLKLMLFLLIFGVLFVAITFGIGIYLALFTDTFEHLKPS